MLRPAPESEDSRDSWPAPSGCQRGRACGIEQFPDNRFVDSRFEGSAPSASCSAGGTCQARLTGTMHQGIAARTAYPQTKFFGKLGSRSVTDCCALDGRRRLYMYGHEKRSAAPHLARQALSVALGPSCRKVERPPGRPETIRTELGGHCLDHSRARPAATGPCSNLSAARRSRHGRPRESNRLERQRAFPLRAWPQESEKREAISKMLHHRVVRWPKPGLARVVCCYRTGWLVDRQAPLQ